MQPIGFAHVADCKQPAQIHVNKTS